MLPLHIFIGASRKLNLNISLTFYCVYNSLSVLAVSSWPLTELLALQTTSATTSVMWFLTVIRSDAQLVLSYRSFHTRTSCFVFIDELSSVRWVLWSLYYDGKLSHGPDLVTFLLFAKLDQELEPYLAPLKTLLEPEDVSPLHTVLCWMISHSAVQMQLKNKTVFSLTLQFIFTKHCTSTKPLAFIKPIYFLTYPTPYTSWTLILNPWPC